MLSYTQKCDIAYSEAAVFRSNPQKKTPTGNIKGVWIAKLSSWGEGRKITHGWKAQLAIERKAGRMETQELNWSCGRKGLFSSSGKSVGQHAEEESGSDGK